MSNRKRNEALQSPAILHQESVVSHRHRAIRVLFVHRYADVVENCLSELKKAQFIVSATVVLDFAQCDKLVRSESYEVVIAEYRRPTLKAFQSLQVLCQNLRHTPLLFITSGRRTETVAQLSTEFSFGYLERNHITQLPMAVRQALKEKELREELEDARQALQHSQSRYRALADNPAYGVYRCNAEGLTVDVNQALANMLGYASKEELLTAKAPGGVLRSMAKDSPSAAHFADGNNIKPFEIEWKRKDGTALRARLSGRGVYDENGRFAGCEVIAVDVTEQRLLEDHLRHQASSDSLTGLANHRSLLEILHAEIARSDRTGREFSLVLFDLDGLKEVNDKFGHPTGDRALCRIGQILADTCRSVDTAARHGGDEFALVLPETSAAAASKVAERISELLAAESEQPTLSVSVGIASHPNDARTISSLLYAADRALYAMKGKRHAADKKSPRGLKLVKTGASRLEGEDAR